MDEVRQVELDDRILLIGTEKGIEPPLSVVKERQPHWEVLGCKDCFRECEHFDDCKSELERRQMKRRDSLCDDCIGCTKKAVPLSNRDKNVLACRLYLKKRWYHKYLSIGLRCK